MKKRIVLFSAIFMFAVLLMAIMPNTVLAATAVDRISITMDEPTAKGTPAQNARVISVTPNYATTNNLEITGWYEKSPEDGSEWVEMTTDNFRAGYYYLPRFETWWWDRYEVGENTILTINGNSVGAYGQWNGFGPVEYIKTTQLDITITEPVIGENPTTTVTGTSEPTEAFNTEVSLKWYEGNTNNVNDFDLSNPMNETDEFKGGKYYLAKFSDNLLNDDYAFDSEAVVTLNGREIDLNEAIIYGLPLPKHTVTFEANGGTGTMNPIIVEEGTYNLPKNAFTAPNEKQFKGWSESATGTVIAGSTIEITKDTTLYAIWEDIPKQTDNPPTGDSIIVTITILTVSVAGIILITKKYKENV